jgi:hypothetical protein
MNKWGWEMQPHPPFMVGDEAFVAEGRWDWEQSLLCLTACRVVYSESEMNVSVKECGIGMSFWFPGAWTIRERSVLVGKIWSSNKAAGSGGGTDSSSVISVSSIDSTNLRSDFSDVRYPTTRWVRRRGSFISTTLY